MGLGFKRVNSNVNNGCRLLLSPRNVERNPEDGWK